MCIVTARHHRYDTRCLCARVPLASLRPPPQMFVDPDGDNHNYYEFEVNALNTIWELVLKKPYKDHGPCVSPYNLPGTGAAFDTCLGSTCRVSLCGPMKSLSTPDSGCLEILHVWVWVCACAGVCVCGCPHSSHSTLFHIRSLPRSPHALGMPLQLIIKPPQQ